MAQTKDYYQILGIERSASEEDIRRAYRRLARQYHPDVNKDPDAAHRFNEITEAYDVLSDAEKRRNYDRFGHAGAAGPAGARTYTWTPRGGGPSGVGVEGFGGDFHTGDFSDLFEQMFRGGAGPQAAHGGSSASPFGRAAPPPRPRRGQDVEHELTVKFLTAALGGTEQLRIGAPGRAPETIDVKIPAGIEDGARLRLRGKGQAGAGISGAGGAAGDLILTIRVGNHPFFRRSSDAGRGLDILGDVPLTLAEAALGTTVTVPLLKGKVEIKVPPGASSGRRLRVKGQGIADAAGKHGDFYAVIQIVAPASLSDSGRSLLEQLAAELPNPRESGPLADTLQGAG